MGRKKKEEPIADEQPMDLDVEGFIEEIQEYIDQINGKNGGGLSHVSQRIYNPEAAEQENAVVTIRSVQRNSDDGDEDLVLSSDGVYTYGEDEIVFAYNESELTGLEGTRTTFHIRPEGVLLQREGTLQAEMNFLSDKKTDFLYCTPAGALPLQLETYYIEKNLTPKGGTLEIRYYINYKNALLSESRFEITIELK